MFDRFAILYLIVSAISPSNSLFLEFEILLIKGNSLVNELLGLYNLNIKVEEKQKIIFTK